MSGASFRDGRLGAGSEPGLELRLGLLGLGIATLFVVFVLRLFQLQILEGADLRSRSERNSVRTVRLEAPRGEIVDSLGRTLATTRPAFRVHVIADELSAPDTTFRVLGMLLEREPAELVELVSHTRGRARFQPLVLDGDLPFDKLARVESHRYALPGVVTGLSPRRHYVEGALAAHLLGTIGEVQAQQLETRAFAGYRSGEIVGQRGLEARFEPHLRGREGGRNLVVNVAGREIEVIDEVEPVPGGRTVLALNLDLQREAELAFAEHAEDEPEKMGALVAMDPRNGDVLAMLSRPAYDPNHFAGGIDSETWRSLTQNEWRPLQDRALTGQYSPGSTYKALVAAAGLADGVVDPDEKVYCPGSYRLGRRAYRCWKRGGHGDMDLTQALVQSCDVYFYALGIELGIDRLAHYARGFGLGRLSGIGLSNEKSGLIPTREWKERVKQEPWIKGETVSASIGQGFNLVTPLQLAVAYSALANGGTLWRPRLVLRLESWDGRVVSEQPAVQRGSVPVPPEALAKVREALTAVVEDPEGTGRRARVPGVLVAGKTGTTQVVSLRVVEQYEDDDVPIRYRDHALFAAFAPADAPEIVVAVVVEHGGGGGSVAAPIAGRVLQRYFDHKREQAGQQLAAHIPEGETARASD